MKTLRRIGMAFLAVMLCVSFVACDDDDDDEAVGGIDMLEGTWALAESKGTEWDSDGSKDTFHEVYDIDHPKMYDERVSFQEATDGRFLITEYEYGYDGWEEYCSEVRQFKSIADFENYYRVKVLKLNAKTMVLFEAADDTHIDTEEVTETYVRVK